MFKKVNEKFSNYPAFANHFEAVDIFQMGKDLFLICREGESDPENAYIQMGTRDYVNGWLYGAVQATCGQARRLDKTLRVLTPEGILVASASGYTAEGYPGIDITLHRADGQEFNVALVEHIPGGESACGYEPLDEVPQERRMKSENGALVCSPGLVTRVWNSYKTLGSEEHIRLFHPDFNKMMLPMPGSPHFEGGHIMSCKERPAAYKWQQNLFDRLAAEHGFVCFRPDYHGKNGDANTVLFYTKEDHAVNEQLEKAGVPYMVGNDKNYKKPFFTFENTDANGFLNYEFGNHGKLDLRGVRAEDTLKGAVLLALAEKRQRDYIRITGGFLELSEAGDTYNDLNREMIAAFKLRYGTAYLGSVNLHGERVKRIMSGGESVYEEYTGQKVYNFACDFIIPVADKTLEKMIRDWNTPGISVNLERLMARISAIGGKHIIWR